MLQESAIVTCVDSFWWALGCQSRFANGIFVNSLANVKNLVPMLIRKILFVIRQANLLNCMQGEKNSHVTKIRSGNSQFGTFFFYISYIGRPGKFQKLHDCGSQPLRGSIHPSKQFLNHGNVGRVLRVRIWWAGGKDRLAAGD